MNLGRVQIFRPWHHIKFPSVELLGINSIFLTNSVQHTSNQFVEERMEKSQQIIAESSPKQAEGMNTQI